MYPVRAKARTPSGMPTPKPAFKAEFDVDEEDDLLAGVGEAFGIDVGLDAEAAV